MALVSKWYRYQSIDAGIDVDDELIRRLAALDMHAKEDDAAAGLERVNTLINQIKSDAKLKKRDEKLKGLEGELKEYREIDPQLKKLKAKIAGGGSEEESVDELKKQQTTLLQRKRALERTLKDLKGPNGKIPKIDSSEYLSVLKKVKGFLSAQLKQGQNSSKLLRDTKDLAKTYEQAVKKHSANLTPSVLKSLKAVDACDDPDKAPALCDQALTDIAKVIKTYEKEAKAADGSTKKSLEAFVGELKKLVGQIEAVKKSVK